MSVPSNYSVLLVDDDPHVLNMLRMILGEEHCLLSAASGTEAVDVVTHDGDAIAAVVMDIKMAGMDGVAAARLITKSRPDIPIIFHTGYPGEYKESDIDASERPFDYIQKGNSIPQLLRSLRNAVETFQLRRDGKSLTDRAEAEYGIVGRSRSVQDVLHIVRKVAPTDSKVMIFGETGTGKELIARALHQSSPRAQKRLAIFNCNHKSPDLVEAELFGHTKGAFTSAFAYRVGIFEYADGGTLFLDEIGDLDITTQAKLLRVLESGEFQIIGAPETRTIGVRLVCATHRDLEQMVKEGSFREDLFYRLKGVQIRLPALRERREDIPLLVQKFCDRFTIERDRSPKMILPEAMNVLVEYDWPGNVRQLLDTIESLTVLTESDVITPADVAFQLKGVGSDCPSKSLSLAERTRDFERTLIIEALTVAGGRVASAAQLLDIDVSNLHRKLKLYSISADLFRG
jgi:two-component system, NtrC family, nitrogen regulation response regulator NtrX